MAFQRPFGIPARMDRHALDGCRALPREFHLANKIDPGVQLIWQYGENFAGRIVLFESMFCLPRMGADRANWSLMI